MAIKVFNDLTGKKEELKPQKTGEIGWYNCGPTVYDFIHIGNARNAVVFDIIRRYLEFRGFKVTYVQNFTDIDDKMINRANEEGITVKELADKYSVQFEIVENILIEWTKLLYDNMRESFNLEV